MKDKLSAFCNSYACTRTKNSISSLGVCKENVRPGTINCSCGSVLQWVKPGGKRQFRAGSNWTGKSKKNEINDSSGDWF